MPHVLIVGQTGSGKSTLACQMAREYQRHGIGVIILDPFTDTRWKYFDEGTKPQCIVTADREYFLNILIHPYTLNCAVFVDESGEMIGQYNKEMFFLATQARHSGHNCHFITQRPQQLNPTVRTQCTYIIAFKCSDGEFLAREFTIPELKEIGNLQKGEYIEGRTWGKSVKKTVNFDI